MRRVNAGRQFGAAPSARRSGRSCPRRHLVRSTSHRHGLVRPGVLPVRPHKATVVRPFMQMKRDQLPQPHRISIYHPRRGRALLRHPVVHPSGMCCDTTRAATGHCCVISGFTPSSEIPPAPRPGIAAATRRTAPGAPCQVVPTALRLVVLIWGAVVMQPRRVLSEGRAGTACINRIAAGNSCARSTGMQSAKTPPQHARLRGRFESWLAGSCRRRHCCAHMRRTSSYMRCTASNAWAMLSPVSAHAPSSVAANPSGSATPLATSRLRQPFSFRQYMR